MNNRKKPSNPDHELYKAILKLESLEECYNFFVDLCTVSEMKAMEQRYEVAKLLNQGMIYNDILENGAVGFVTYDGNANYCDRDIDQRELRSFVHKGNKIPGVNINAKDAVALIKQSAKTAKLTLKQDEYVGKSRNVILAALIVFIKPSS